MKLGIRIGIVLFALGASGLTGCETQAPGIEPEVTPAPKAGGALPPEQETCAGWPFDAAEAKGRQKEAAERLGIPVEKTIDLGGGISMKLVLIPPGEFMMGSDKGGEDEKPVHKVTLTRAFYIGEHEVTQSQYEKVTGANPSAGRGPERPVENVSWNDAAAFCTKLSQLTKEILRLPTEAEWEYACRSGTATRWCFGDEGWMLGEHGWYCDNSGIETHPGGGKSPNALGLRDMHGNVSEWCADWYGKRYEEGPAEDPTGVTTGTFRVFRGGSYVNDFQICRSAHRDGRTASDKEATLGFRVVAAAEAR